MGSKCPRYRSGVPQNAAHALGETGPALLLLRELFAAGGGERIETGLPVLFRGAPFGAHPAVLLHAVERRIERALLDAEQLGRGLLNVRGDGVAVHLALRFERLEHEESQGSLEDVILLSWHRFT